MIYDDIEISYVYLICIAEHKTRVFAAVEEMLRWFAGHQIRNVAVSWLPVPILVYVTPNCLFHATAFHDHNGMRVVDISDKIYVT